MSMLPALLILFALQPDSPASDVEVQRAVSALEKSLVLPKSMEIRFREFYDLGQAYRERSASAGMRPIESGETELAYKPDKSIMVSFSPGEPTKPRAQTWFDGITTRNWTYFQDPWKLSHVQVHSGKPSGSQYRGLGSLGTLMSLDYEKPGESLTSYLKAAKSQQTLTGKHVAGGLEIGIGSHLVNKVKYQISFTVDPTHDYRMTSRKLAYIGGTEAPFQIPLHVISFIIDDYQSVMDEASNTPVWFPRRAHSENSLVTSPFDVRIEVESVRINPEIPDERFAHPEPPLGTRMMEQSANRDVLSRSWIVGGEAEEKKIRDQQQKALEPVMHLGVLFWPVVM